MTTNKDESKKKSSTGPQQSSSAAGQVSAYQFALNTDTARTNAIRSAGFPLSFKWWPLSAAFLMIPFLDCASLVTATCSVHREG